MKKRLITFFVAVFSLFFLVQNRYTFQALISCTFLNLGAVVGTTFEINNIINKCQNNSFTNE